MNKNIKYKKKYDREYVCETATESKVHKYIKVKLKKQNKK